jgi:hypothetical protein
MNQYVCHPLCDELINQPTSSLLAYAFTPPLTTGLLKIDGFFPPGQAYLHVSALHFGLLMEL